MNCPTVHLVFASSGSFFYNEALPYFLATITIVLAFWL